jgi:hypothetical protein
MGDGADLAAGTTSAKNMVQILRHSSLSGQTATLLQPDGCCNLSESCILAFVFGNKLHLYTLQRYMIEQMKMKTCCSLFFEVQMQLKHSTNTI